MAHDSLAPLLFLLRTALNLSALLAIGFALQAMLGVVDRGSLKAWRAGILGWTLIVITLAAARFILLDLELGGSGDLLDPAMLALCWTTLGGATLALAAGAVAMAAGGIFCWRILSGLGALLAAASFGLTGHTQSLDNPGLAPAEVSVHVLIAAFWATAPLTLWPRAGLRDEILLKRLHAFSAYALAAIPIMVLLGLWLAWRLAGGVQGLTGTSYGRLLLLKLAAALAAMAAGAFNQRIVTAKVASSPATGRRWLRRTLGAESTLFAGAVLAVSAATTLTGMGES